LPVDPAIVNGVLLALRRDTPGSATGWSLGAAARARSTSTSSVPAPTSTWTATARLWDPQAVAVVQAVVDVTVVEPDSCESRSGRISRSRPVVGADAALLDLAAPLDEFAEELLWHATRESLPSHELP
jgi:hypothetical protein